MKIGYFPGCSMEGSAPEYGESLEAIVPFLDVQFQAVEDWNCCGASSAHATNHELAVALAARNLALAEEQGLGELFAPCAACYSRLAVARHELGTQEARERVGAIIGRDVHDDISLLNVLQLLESRIDLIAEQSTDSLFGVKFACYYGCLLVRPAEVTAFDDPEQPTTMERIVRACSGTPVPWTMATECCGGGLSMSRTDSVLRLGRGILDAARAAGAAAVVAACPMCHSNLDFRQEAMSKSGAPPMPILYISQVVGIAFGLDDEALGLRRHFVDPRPFAEELRAASTGLRMAERGAKD